ncbi:MAG: hypothetical protein UR12_C0003G0001, partial [candidate division TM6 bacterium GW2011_GWF2_30_66]
MYNKKITIYMLILISSNIFGMHKYKHKTDTKKLVNTVLEVLKTVNSSNEANNIQKTITKHTPILNTNTLSNITKQDSITEFTVKIKSLIKDVNNTDSKKETRTFNGKQSEGSSTSSSSFFVPYSSKNQNTSKSLTNFYDFRNFDTDINLRATLEKLAQNNQLKSYSETVNNTTITHYFGPESNTSILSTFNNGNTKGIILNKITINNFEDITNNSWSTPTFSLANCSDGIKNGSIVFLSDGRKGTISFLGKIAVLVPTCTNSNQTYNKDWSSNIFEKEPTPNATPSKNTNPQPNTSETNNQSPAPVKNTETNKTESKKPKQGLVPQTNFDKCSKEEIEKAKNSPTLYNRRTTNGDYDSNQNSNSTKLTLNSGQARLGNNNYGISTDSGSLFNLGKKLGRKFRTWTNGKQPTLEVLPKDHFDSDEYYDKHRFGDTKSNNLTPYKFRTKDRQILYGSEQDFIRAFINGDLNCNLQNLLDRIAEEYVNKVDGKNIHSKSDKELAKLSEAEQKFVVESIERAIRDSESKLNQNEQYIDMALKTDKNIDGVIKQSAYKTAELSAQEKELERVKGIFNRANQAKQEKANKEQQEKQEKQNQIKQSNQNNLNTATTQYAEKVQENATTENTTYSDILLEKVLGEQAKVAQQVLDQNPDQQQQNITYDITGFDPSFVDKFALTSDQLDLLSTGTALQGYNQNVLIYLLKKAENLDQLKSNNPYIYLLLDSSI